MQIFPALLPFTSRLEHIACPVPPSVLAIASHLAATDVPIKSVAIEDIYVPTGGWGALSARLSSSARNPYFGPMFAAAPQIKSLKITIDPVSRTHILHELKIDQFYNVSPLVLDPD
ncbi:hypothetical protein B0H17DRAFT_1141822 [Mycena rosella]|uniref:Uncharacterized protein n=1 Tax=Mycena rosella TaxID=1033263 RepID=A0AAD7CYS5_MYCRO|nr:hypothetical protein B0H17DRAFT_1141822 [Mycena rosella]